MKKLLVLASSFAFILAFAPAAARAAQNSIASTSAPIVDTFEDGDQHLRLVGSPAADGERMQVTIVYEDAERQARRSITIDPASVTPTGTPELTAFLAEMDPGFLSYVRASLADRLLHLKAAPTGFDRAVSTVFFPRAPRDGRMAHTAAESESKAE